MATNVVYCDFDVPTWPDDVSKRLFNRFAKEALEEAARLHHSEHIPNHFTHEGARKYGYRERQPKYNRYKMRKYGHMLPLVYTGQSRKKIVKKPPKITKGGTAVANNLSATLHMRFAFGRGRDPGRRRPGGFAGTRLGYPKRKKFKLRLGFFGIGSQWRHAQLKPADLKAELAAVTADEVETISRKFQRHFMMQLSRRIAEKKRKTKRRGL